jgi:ABC-type multidrug transport system permease subunit
MVGIAHDLRVVRALAIKDIQSSLTERLFSSLAIIVPLNFLLLFLLFVITGGQAPTAVVLEDQGPLARQFLSAMEHANSFLIHETTATDARRLMEQGQIVAIVTVPASFDADLQAGRQVQLPVLLNNLNVDFTNDIRRAVPLAITSFYAEAFPNQLVVQAKEIDTYTHDTGYLQYLAVSIVVVGLMIGGLLQAGNNAAREYETGTIKELLLSPASRWAIELGKVLGALTLNAVSAAVILAVVIFVLGVVSVRWGELLGFALILMVTFVALGTLVGTLVRRRQAVIPVSLGISLPIFFMSGAFGPVTWGSAVVATFARLQPVYYAIAVFQEAFHGFKTTTTGLVTNGLLLVCFAALAVIVSAIVLRRGEVAH